MANPTTIEARFTDTNGETRQALITRLAHFLT
jgi:hypothetical protein